LILCVFIYSLFCISCFFQTKDRSIEETKLPFTAIKTKYIDKAIDYEYSKNNMLISRSKNLEYGDFVTKYNLLLSLVSENKNIFNNRSSNVIADEVFYSDLASELTDEIDGLILISDSEISVDDVSSVDVPQIQTVQGISFSLFEILDMAEKDILGDNKFQTRGLISTSTNKWEDEIPYRFEDSVSEEARINIRYAMDEWEEASENAFSFTEIENSGWNKFIWILGDNHLRIFTDSSDSSIGGAATLGKGAWRSFNIVTGSSMRTCRHELGHVLGLEHEQCRYDRDNYITVTYDNIKEYDSWWNKNYYKSQFDKIEKGRNIDLYITIRLLFWTYSKKITIGYKEISRVYGTFDYESVMLYNSWAFSKNNLPDVMLKKDGDIIYTNYEISELDKLSVKSIYSD